MKKKWLERLRSWFRRRAIPYKGLYLPPRRMRFCDDRYRDDEFFVGSAGREVQRLVDLCGLTQNSAILDIGSGQGRLAIGLLQRFKNFRDYHGIDVHKPSVEWCQRWITRWNPQFVFTYVDIANDRYNPTGASKWDALPLPSSRFDIVFAYSVFTHMRSADVAGYLAQMRRVLKGEGKALFTAFVESGVQDECENPPGYLGCPVRGRLGRVRYERNYFCRMIQESRFTIDRFDHAVESLDGQSVFAVHVDE